MKLRMTSSNLYLAHWIDWQVCVCAGPQIPPPPRQFTDAIESTVLDARLALLGQPSHETEEEDDDEFPGPGIIVRFGYDWAANLSFS
jgi:hypothetical protein